MRNQHSYKVHGVTISKRNFLEKDRILTIFTLEEGKIDVLSKGARRPGSRLSYVSDLGTICQYQIAKTRSIDIVTDAKTIFLPDGAFGNLQKSNRIFYSLKIIGKLYHEGEPHPKTFNALVELVRSSANAESQLSFLIFLQNIIADLGVTPELISCVFCSLKILPKDDFDFNLKGGIAHRKCDLGDKMVCTSEAIKFMRLLFSGGEIGPNAKIKNEVFEEVYQILRAYLAWHFQDILPIESF